MNYAVLDQIIILVIDTFFFFFLPCRGRCVGVTVAINFCRGFWQKSDRVTFTRVDRSYNYKNQPILYVHR